MIMIIMIISNLMMKWRVGMQYSLYPWHRIPEESTICIQMGLRPMMMMMMMLMMMMMAKTMMMLKMAGRTTRCKEETAQR